MIAQKLKTETKTHHNNLESALLATKIMDGSLSKEEYFWIIGNHFLIHQHLENQFNFIPDFKLVSGIEINSRRKLPFLAKDIAENNIDLAKYTLPHEYKIQNIDELMGVLYVLEGSTLGGAIILKALQNNPLLSDVSHYHYFGCYGYKLYDNWERFRNYLNSYAENLEDDTKIIEAAISTFKFFESVFKYNS